MLTYSTLKVYSPRQSHEFCIQQQIISRQNIMGNYLTTCKAEYHKLSRPSIAQVNSIGMGVILSCLDNK